MADIMLGPPGYAGGNGAGPDTLTPSDPLPPLTAAEVRRRWQDGTRATNRERYQAAVNRAFIRNRQWVYWNKETNRLEEAPRVPGRVRASVPRIGPDSRRIIAKLMRRELSFDVQPTAPDDATVRAARISEAALVEAHRKQSWERVRHDHAWITWEGGLGALAVDWDNSVGTEVAADQSGQPIRTGDVRLRALSIHEIATEPGAPFLETSGWWVSGQAFPPREVQRRFRLPRPPMTDAQHLDGIHGAAGGDRTTPSPLTLVLTCYQRPTEGQEGKVVVVVNDNVVEEGPWPFPFDDHLNITTAVVQPLHHSWLGHTPVSDAVPIQALYNASWSSIVEHLKLAGNARLWVPMGSVDDIEDLTDTPGEAQEYNPIGGLRPQYEAPPSMPDWWIRQPGMLEMAMDDVLSIHDVSRGEAPTGVESGVALSVLAEADDTPTGAFAKELAECWGRAATMVLQLYETRVQESRQASITLARGIPEVVQWTGGDLMGQTTAVVPLDAVMPRSRAAQAAYALQLFDRQIITTPRELAKVADLPDQDDLLEGIDPDTARAQRENFHMAVGIARTVDQIDDHANHINVHRDFMRSERFERLDPELRMIFVEHLAAHEQYAAGQAAQQRMMGMADPFAAAIPTAATKPVPDEVAAITATAEQAVEQGQGMQVSGPQGGSMSTTPPTPEPQPQTSTP